MSMFSREWGREKAVGAYATYIGRGGCSVCPGVEVHVLPGRITLAPAGVDGCQIDVPASEIDGLVALLQEAKAELAAARPRRPPACQASRGWNPDGK